MPGTPGWHLHLHKPADAMQVSLDTSVRSIELPASSFQLLASSFPLPRWDVMFRVFAVAQACEDRGAGQHDRQAPYHDGQL